MFLNSFFLQNAALSHQTMLLASQFGVTESIPVTFGGPRCILDALEQFLRLRGPQNANFGGLWVFTKNLVFYVKMLLNSFFLQNAALSHQIVLERLECIDGLRKQRESILRPQIDLQLTRFGETRQHFGEKMNSKTFLPKISDFW